MAETGFSDAVTLIRGGLAALMAANLVTPVAAQTKDCADNPAISWKAVGRFAVLKGQDARERGDGLVEAIADAGGRLVDDPVDTASTPSAYPAIVAALVEDATDGPAPLYTATYWDRDRERYVNDGDLLVPKRSEVRATFPAGSGGNCIWTLNGTTSVAVCSDTRLEIPRGADGRLLAAVSVRSDAGATATTCIAVEERLIIGLGDSYASGEGNPDRPTRWDAIPAVRDATRRTGEARKTWSLWNRNRRGPIGIAPAEADAQWWDNGCHRSLLSQQSLAALGHAARDPHRVVTFLSYACSGATVVDGIIGPRLEAPGVSRRPADVRAASVAVTESQLTQILRTLCKGEITFSDRPIPDALPVWRALRRPAKPAGEKTGEVRIPSCPAGLLRQPDALLLSVGGNDVGFGGVGFWAIVPPADRLRLPVDFVAGSSISADREAAKRDFGLVCPKELGERRCRRSAFTAQDLLRELPGLYGLMDEAIATAGLASVPVKIQMSYPPVARDELGRLCGELWAERVGTGYETQIEPWMPLYGKVLDTFRIGRFTPAASLGPWSFGIFNTVTAEHCYDPIDPTRNQYAEMCIIERDVYRPLNQAVAGHDSGWRIVGTDDIPARHGICAADGRLAAGLVRPKPRDAGTLLTESRMQFGWPRWDAGWLKGWPAPQDWKPYAPRARWFRTATDSALTQTVFDGGTAARRPKGSRKEDARHDEATIGTIHPTLQMHAAMAERLVDALEGPTP